MKIFNYTLTIALLLLSLTSTAQQKEKKVKPKRTDNYIHMPGLRLGLDISRPFQQLWTKGDRYGSEFSADFEASPNLYLVAEAGWEKLKLDQPRVNYNSSGTYLRLGADYNVLGPEDTDTKSMFYFGFRYAFDIARQQTDSYTIQNYWGSTMGSFPEQKFNSHWMELILGIKGEIVKNFYMGWSIRAKFLLAQTAEELPEIYFTPGFGKSESTVALDFTYSIYYTLPFKFRKK
ncbi:DUF6048 family protein [Mangrovibacterium marinum]|uniref:Outer membrane protein with beta-barrel domain n=1 Tax=Mangrovibacterium marinum TaxID=1639118 RepID=A0A2T5C294_9BACT|nr:DUF6048 family protein [Mangrovibacterium marinum]PTN08771.1 hypothetical protein C8N47_107131 [Mangrovibacterium marinum]